MSLHLYVLKNIRCYFTVLGLIWCVGLQAQDPSFSQFYANRIYLNPAFVGLESGITVSATSRLQWLQTDNGFRTYNVSIETQLPYARLGLGIHLLSDTEGIANLRTRTAGAVMSYTIPGKNSNLHFGFEARMVQKDIDWDKLIFSDQLDPMDGLVGQGSVVPAVEKTSYADLDFGIVWRRVGDINWGKNKWRDVRSQLGISIHHLPSLMSSSSAQGNDSFLNRETRIAPRITFHGGLIIPISSFRGSGLDLAISPNFKLDMQGYKFLNSKENITVGTLGFYTLINNYYLGLLYQNRQFVPNSMHTDAFILTLGGYTVTSKSTSGDDPRLFFGISVDVNTTGVGPLAGSVFEATIRYRIVPTAGWGAKRKKSGKSSKRILDCKSFF